MEASTRPEEYRMPPGTARDRILPTHALQNGGVMTRCGMRPLILLLLVFILTSTKAVRVDEEFGIRAHRDWPLAGGDWANGRYSTLTQITRANVGKLAGS